MTQNGRYRIAVTSLGCKANLADLQSLESLLTNENFEFVDFGQPADVVILNTCTVTARAEQDARKWLARSLHRYPAAPVVVTGCLVQVARARVAAWPGVTAVVGVADRPRLLLLLQSLAEGQPVPPDSAPDAPWSLFPTETDFVPKLPRNRCRPFVKIQDGCDRHCTYCMVPQARGPARSVAPERVLAWLEQLGRQRVQEVVLAGIHLGRYGCDLKPSLTLTELLGRIATQRSVPRIRLSSLEPEEIDDPLLALLASDSGFCPHLHVPLQNGADIVLQRMGRTYRAEEGAALLGRIRQALPDAAIGLDILVGFPGESEREFGQTLELLEHTDWTYLHVFAFSARPGTPAAQFADPVPAAVCHDRVRHLRQLDARRRLAFARRLTGQCRQVLVESEDAQRTGWFKGLTDNYQRVAFASPHPCKGQLVEVRLIEAQPTGILARMVDSPTDAPGASPSADLVISHRFHDARWLEEALTHRSYRNEHPHLRYDNERLEFLGDAVLGLIVSETLMQRFRDEDEGELTRVKGRLVSETSLAEVARRLSLGSCVRLGHGEMLSGGAEKPSILACAFEAVVAAIYSDGGLAAARDFVMSCFQEQLSVCSLRSVSGDSKSILQQRAQRLYREAPEYHVLEERGPQHAKTFRVAVTIGERVAGEAEGPSKKQAEQSAAAVALRDPSISP